MSRPGKPSADWFERIDEFDYVLISGMACSPVRYFENLYAGVATISIGKERDRDEDDDDYEDYVKVWPMDEDAAGAGKVWFRRDKVTACHLLLPREN